MFENTKKELRKLSRYFHLIDRLSWRYYRGGGAIIGLMQLWYLAVVPIESRSRAARRQARLSRLERSYPIPTGNAHVDCRGH